LKTAAAPVSRVVATQCISVPSSNLKELAHRYMVSNQADGKSPRTVGWYDCILRDYLQYLKANGYRCTTSRFEISTAREYVNHLRNRKKYTGHPSVPQQNSVVSVETVRGHVRGLKAFSSWLYRESYVAENRLINLKQPRAHTKVMMPLSPDEIALLLRCFNRRIYTGERNNTLVTLLDTGLRVSELAGIRLKDIDLANGYVKVMGKGFKERVVPVGEYTLRLLTNYIHRERPKAASKNCHHLFVTRGGRPITPNAIKLMFSRLAQQSGIPRVHSHLCRHTFAINYLLNGGDIFSLKAILGHASLTMVSRYLHFTSSQITEQHRKYSPMDRMIGVVGG